MVVSKNLAYYFFLKRGTDRLGLRPSLLVDSKLKNIDSTRHTSLAMRQLSVVIAEMKRLF